MADYKEMYLSLYRVHTKVIDLLKEVTARTEELYIDTETPLSVAFPNDGLMLADEEMIHELKNDDSESEGMQHD